jgi:hypothetical protein
MTRSPGLAVPHTAAHLPLSILRTETVLSRFPVHLLTKRGRVSITIRRTNVQGELDVRWEVSYNERYGPPRQLAYKLDTIVINQILDALPRPLPSVIKIGGLRQTCRLLDVEGSGRQQADLKNAFHQNASAYIVAKLCYRDRDGTQRLLEAGFTRYSVIFKGERLPDGTTADAIYLLLHEAYREVLNHAPVRPLDYAYLKILTPAAQRLYEILSYKMFAALKHRHPYATLRYADYCLLSTQQRYADYEHVKKQMYKVHRPHLASGYITKVHYEGTTDADGQPDWFLHYIPGAKARAEYAAFMHQPGAEAAALTLSADADPQDLVATITREPPAAPPPPPAEASLPPGVAPAAQAPAARPAPLPEAMPPEAAAPAGRPDLLQAEAQTLVTAFYQRFHGLTQVTPSPKELAHATALLAQYGEAKAHFFLTFAHQAATATHYQPQLFGGILSYLPHALAAYDMQATHAATQHAEAAERTRREQYAQWRQDALAQLRAALPPAELAALEDAQHARLVAAGTPAFALGLAVRVAVDAALEAQAGLPVFAAWQQQREVCR